MAEDRIPRRLLAGLIVGSLAVIGGLAASLLLLFHSTERDPQEVVTAAQRVLRERFPQAADLRFAPMNNTRLESKGDNRYLVTGWVEVTGQEGEKAMFDYSCIMLTVSGGQWVSEEVQVVPRP